MIDAIWMGTPSFRNKLFWILQLIGWVGVLFGIVAFAGLNYMHWSLALLISGVRSAAGIGLTYLLRLVYRRLLSSGQSMLVIGLVAVVLCLVMANIDIELTRRVGSLAGLDMQSDLFEAYLTNSVVSRWVLYVFWTLMYFGINYWLDTQQIQLALARAEASAHASELKALKAQINPHFLFNALSSILAESGDNVKIRNLTLALSDYLRFLLQQRKDQAELGQELEALESYLRVEKARFEEKLVYSIDADAHARAALVPASLVQPLLENAIKYGQRTSPKLLTVRITAQVQDEFMVLMVSNSGTWVAPENNQSTKTGLANLRRRLELVYGEKATLEILTGEETVTLEVRLPVKSVTSVKPGKTTT